MRRAQGGAAAVLALAAWLLGTTLPVAAAVPAEQVQRDAAQVLDWLGYTALLRQIPQVLSAAAETERQFRGADAAQVTAWRRRVAAQLQVKQLRQQLTGYLADRYRPEAFQRGLALLQQPLARRVRYFDLAMEQAAAQQGLQDYRAALVKTPQPARRALLRGVDEAAGTSAQIAALQTYVAEGVRRAAGAGATPPEQLVAEQAERARYLAPFTQDYLMYSYRYLTDDDVQAYRALLGDEQLQWLIKLCRQGLVETLQDTLTER